jgi:hypothetical protein
MKNYATFTALLLLLSSALSYAQQQPQAGDTQSGTSAVTTSAATTPTNNITVNCDGCKPAEPKPAVSSDVKLVTECPKPKTIVKWKTKEVVKWRTREVVKEVVREVKAALT